MSGNVAQVTSVKALHETGDTTLTGWDKTKGEYNIAHPDPYELAHANAKLNAPVSIATTGTALDITVDGGTSDVSATVTTWGGGSITEGIVYTIDAGTTGATIDQTGTVTASGLTGGDGTVTTTATYGELSVTETIVITNQLT